MSRQGTVAILGRPNVGKSSFFNYVTGKRISIVEDVPGVTRDRIYEEVEWSGKRFTLIDTGGLEPKSTDTILKQMKRQAELAVELADVILFMVDMKDGLTASDMDIATLIRKTKKPVILVVNKVDKVGEPPADIYEFYNLGLGDFYSVSSAHGLGIGEVLDAVLENLPEYDEDDDKMHFEWRCEAEGIKFSIDGGNSRDWNWYFKNNGNSYSYHIESEIYIVVPSQPEYYLSISEFPRDPYITYSCEETGTMYEEADLSEVIGLKIVSWDFEVNSK